MEMQEEKKAEGSQPAEWKKAAAKTRWVNEKWKNYEK